MVGTVLKFLQTHREVMPRYALIIVHDLFCIIPKAFDPIDMDFG